MEMYSLFLQAQGTPGLQSLWPFLALIVVFYFFLIRPQQKRQKELRTYRDSLKKGDKIVTTGGIYGRVYDIKDNKVIMEISDNLRITVDKAAVVMDMTDTPK